MTKSIYDVRRENLRRLMAEWGGPTSLAKKLGHANGSYLAQVAGPHPRRVIGEKVARQIEERLHLPAGSLDATHTGRSEPVRDEVLTECVQAVAAAVSEAGLTPAPAQFAELVSLVYDRHRSIGTIDEPYIHRLMRLIK